MTTDLSTLLAALYVKIDDEIGGTWCLGRSSGTTNLTGAAVPRSLIAHEHRDAPALATAAPGLLAALGLQRARVRAFVIRADEAAADRARRRFGPEAVRVAAVAAGAM
ncbi:hypothetical protein [Streptomyces sp. NBC_01537]|uniref:hypothetical protein n=1 Tax=Streptomyces sp. NBC_01537 TaxID=2903896 RepID=UPI00386E025F